MIMEPSWMQLWCFMTRFYDHGVFFWLDFEVPIKAFWMSQRDSMIMEPLWMQLLQATRSRFGRGLRGSMITEGCLGQIFEAARWYFSGQGEASESQVQAGKQQMQVSQSWNFPECSFWWQHWVILEGMRRFPYPGTFFGIDFGVYTRAFGGHGKVP